MVANQLMMTLLTLTLGKTIHGKIRVYFHRSGSGNVDSDIVVNGIGIGEDISYTGWRITC